MSFREKILNKTQALSLDIIINSGLKKLIIKFLNFLTYFYSTEKELSFCPCFYFLILHLVLYLSIINHHCPLKTIICYLIFINFCRHIKKDFCIVKSMDRVLSDLKEYLIYFFQFYE